MPTVSIIMPTYNRSHTICMALDSILRQKYKDWEVLIIDNGSTDNTPAIVKEYCNRDKRIKYFNIDKSAVPGISEYLNYGMKTAEGKYIARLDDDDEWCSDEKLQKQVNFLDANSDYIIVGSGAIMVDASRKEIFKFYKRETDNQIRNKALMANPFWHNTVMFRKDDALNAGGYHNLRFVEDWDLWLRLGKKGKLYNFKEHFSLYMNAGQNLSISNQKLAGKLILQLISRYKNDYPNFKKAFMLNSLQLVFAYLPIFIKKRIQNTLFYIKRNYF